MSARDLANVLIKILGIYWLVQALLLLVQGSMMPFMGLQNVEGFNWKLQAISLFLYVALYAIASYCLIFQTPAILRLMALDEDTTGFAVTNSQPGYASFAFSLLGAFFAIPAFGHVLSDLIKLASQRQEAGAYYGLFSQSILMNILPGLAENVAKLIIGIALVIGREKLGQLWKRLRPLAANEDEKN
jgi:hypothetical protein